VAAGLEGSRLDGRLAWALTVDSGLLRAQRFPETVAVCTSSSPTGLDLLGRGTCMAPGGGQRPLVFLVPSTALGPGLTANGQPRRRRARDTLFVREEPGEPGWEERLLSLRAGRQRIAVGDGFVDDYALGLKLDVDLGRPRAAAGPLAGRLLAHPRTGWGRSSLAMLALRADWTPSLFEHVGIFAAWAHDETGVVGGLLRSANTEAAVVRLQRTAPGSAEYILASWVLAALLSVPLSGTSDLAWAGVSGHIFPGERHEWWTARWSSAGLGAGVPAGVPGAVLQDVPVEACSAGFAGGSPGRRRSPPPPS
jgi:hypothetical protein